MKLNKVLLPGLMIVFFISSIFAGEDFSVSGEVDGADTYGCSMQQVAHENKGLEQQYRYQSYCPNSDSDDGDDSDDGTGDFD